MPNLNMNPTKRAASSSRAGDAQHPFMLRRAFGSRVQNNGPEGLNDNEANSGEQPGPAAVQEKQDI